MVIDLEGLRVAPAEAKTKTSLIIPEGNGVVIGRGVGSEDVLGGLDNAKISNAHARLYVYSDQLLIEDLKSSNGTFHKVGENWVKCAPHRSELLLPSNQPFIRLGKENDGEIYKYEKKDGSWTISHVSHSEMPEPKEDDPSWVRMNPGGTVQIQHNQMIGRNMGENRNTDLSTPSIDLSLLRNQQVSPDQGRFWFDNGQLFIIDNFSTYGTFVSHGQDVWHNVGDSIRRSGKLFVGSKVRFGDEKKGEIFQVLQEGGVWTFKHLPKSNI